MKRFLVVIDTDLYDGVDMLGCTLSDVASWIEIVTYDTIGNDGLSKHPEVKATVYRSLADLVDDHADRVGAFKGVSHPSLPLD